MPDHPPSRAETALVILDMQNDIVHTDSPLAGAPAFSALFETLRSTRVVEKCRALLDEARATGVTVVHVVVDFTVGTQFQFPRRGHFFASIGGQDTQLLKPGTWGGAIHELLAPREGEIVVGKSIFSAFASNDLHDQLRARGVRELVLAGVATDIVVECTSWAASDLGYDVQIAADCCCSHTVDAHQSALGRIAARADIVSSADVVGQWAGRTQQRRT